jgi:hypothetical protein
MIHRIVHLRIPSVVSAIVSFATCACSCDAAGDAGGAGTGGVVTGGSTSGATGGAAASAGAGGIVATGGSGNGTGGIVATGGSGVGTGGIVATGGSGNGASGGGATGGSGVGTGGMATGGSPGVGGTTGTGGTSTTRCDDPSLVWRSANKTNYTSYPDPGSPECIQYNGCMWAGQFAACNGTKPESWVASHNIVALFPLDPYSDHDLCLRSGSNKIVVTAIDTCGDSDCNGCCTQNRGTADALVDVESYTDARWGVPDGPIEWADLGLNPNACN